jgi:hypothetical protein
MNSLRAGPQPGWPLGPRSHGRSPPRGGREAGLNGKTGSVWRPVEAAGSDSPCAPPGARRLSCRKTESRQLARGVLRVQEPLMEAIQSRNSPSPAVPFDTLATLPSATTNTSFGTPLT